MPGCGSAGLVGVDIQRIIAGNSDIGITYQRRLLSSIGNDVAMAVAAALCQLKRVLPVRHGRRQVRGVGWQCGRDVSVTCASLARISISAPLSASHFTLGGARWRR
jgi:hypothetical protein